MAPESLSKRFDKLETKVDAHHEQIMSKLEEIKLDSLSKHFELSRRVDDHDRLAGMGKWCLSGGGLLGLFAMCKDYFFSAK